MKMIGNNQEVVKEGKEEPVGVNELEERFLFQSTSHIYIHICVCVFCVACIDTRMSL